MFVLFMLCFVFMWFVSIDKYSTWFPRREWYNQKIKLCLEPCLPRRKLHPTQFISTFCPWITSIVLFFQITVLDRGIKYFTGIVRNEIQRSLFENIVVVLGCSWYTGMALTSDSVTPSYYRGLFNIHENELISRTYACCGYVYGAKRTTRDTQLPVRSRQYAVTSSENNHWKSLTPSAGMQSTHTIVSGWKKRTFSKELLRSRMDA